MMATDPNKTVFISYRRLVSRDRAVLIFNHLLQQGYDVFLDVKTIDSGAFDSVILNQIGARTHFIVLIADGALQRCQNESDWLRREIEEALKLGRNIVPIIDEGVNFDQEMGYLPSAWRDHFKRINSLPWVHYYFDSALRDLVERFLKPPTFPVKINSVSADEERMVQQRIAEVIQTSQKPSSLDIIPQPFAWVDISAGKSKSLLGQSFIKDAEYDILSVDTFKMAKYPITNAQFDVFINHPNGYQDSQWWDFSNGSKKWHDENPQPTHSAFGGNLLPRTNVSWYEALAFCRWLSQMGNENITLPTKEQWIRAAQGDDGRVYPWGNTWDGKRCNNSASNPFVAFGFGRSKSPTPVTKYENLGDSPFGVVDMVGNVSEWCLDRNRFGSCWALGASWGLEMTHYYWANSKYVYPTYPDERHKDIGFRIVRLP